MRITIKKSIKRRMRIRIRRKRLPVARSGDLATTRFAIATKSGSYFRHGPRELSATPSPANLIIWEIGIDDREMTGEIDLIHPTWRTDTHGYRGTDQGQPK